MRYSDDYLALEFNIYYLQAVYCMADRYNLPLYFVSKSSRFVPHCFDGQYKRLKSLKVYLLFCKFRWL